MCGRCFPFLHRLFHPSGFRRLALNTALYAFLYCAWEPEDRAIFLQIEAIVALIVLRRTAWVAAGIVVIEYS
ncbi:MAG: hypothetical protein CTY22_04630 [Methylomonas sp.]|nr:MAG: hypothetical protein CTY23_09195 [Methylomonas sp.]PPD26622.1 MAG: hypothetical protein CTY22_04630 [Methylomonas sp.]PPD40434.1 MAG: hypothetical protein CTY17_06425 [Methylomonas sp.]PPD53234.1 MAG: hypothetical protein CTY11_06970 [Methylomonas sp.]